MASLKYYAEIWLRAKLFAQIVGFYQTDDEFFNKRHSGTSENRFPAKINEGRLDETEYTPFNDIYSQEFFLHCYSLVSRERSLYVESKEGHTYIRAQLEDKISTRAMGAFITTQEHAKWTHKIRKITKKMKQDPKDDYDTDFVDIDVII